MNYFEFWKKWSSPVSGIEFANAWVVLGLLSPFKKSQGYNLVDPNYSYVEKELLPEMERELEESFFRIILKSKRRSLLPWNFPSPDQKIKIGGNPVALAEIHPGTLAKLWSKGYSLSRKLFRLSVMSYPDTESVNPWFQLLFRADLPFGTAYLNMALPKSDVHLNWPLRMGYFAGNAGEQIIRRTVLEGPSNEHTQPVAINRDNANCDILVYHGNLTQLIKEVLDLPVQFKCNLFILRGPDEEQYSLPGHWLSAVTVNSHSNGFVLLPTDTPDQGFIKGLNCLLTSLSRNRSFDFAITQAFTREIATEPMIFLTHGLAGYSIRNLVVKLKKGFFEMPVKSIRSEELQSFQRMNLQLNWPATDNLLTEDTSELEWPINRASKRMEFENETGGARELKYLNYVCKMAGPDKPTLEKRSARFVQSRMFIQKGGKYVEEKFALIKDIPSRIRIRIGPPDGEWITLQEAEFPVEKLPKHLESWRLTVVLSEPNHLPKPLVGEIRLPRDGASTECDFSFTPAEEIPFEGRVTVLHRGRVIQTCIMKVNVGGSSLSIPPNSKIEMTERIPVFSSTGELESRRQFDMAFVENHSSGNQPRVTAIAGKHAWLKNLSDCEKMATEINAALTKVAMSVNDYSGGLESEENRKLLVELAQYGCYLYDFIVRDQLEGQSATYDATAKEYIQIVSTRAEAVIPFEFIYDHKAPDDDATLCKSWREALADGKCHNECKTKQEKHVCPLGFWGLSKVIERHIYTPGLDPENKDYYLQTEPVKGRATLSLGGPFLVGASTRVNQANLDQLIKTCEKSLGSTSKRASDWDQWAEIVKSFKPSLILALPHTEGSGAMMALEIGGKKKKSIQIDRSYVHAEKSLNYPLVALLGCDTTGTAQDYGSHVSKFRREGAAVVIGTIATVFGGHAVQVAEMLITGLTQKSGTPERLGEVIRSVKREALQKGLLMALCVVAFGDSDWKFNKSKS